LPAAHVPKRRAHGIETITATGDVDGATAAQFHAAIAAATGERIVVDLTAASYFDRSGLRALLEFAGKLSEVVVLRDGAVQRLFALVALDQVLPIRVV
jgi:anti-anti-sigma factor